MRALTKKLLRESWHLRGQLLAIVAVVACGIANFIAMRSVERSLYVTRAAFYDGSRFADVFVNVRRAGEHIADRLREIDGVAIVETRVVADVMLDIEGVHEPASGVVVSIPDGGQPELNQLVLRNGRLPRSESDAEVVVSSAFADANTFSEGSTFYAVMNGRRRLLTIVGTAVSPEYVLEMKPGSFMIDNKRYGIMWMGRKGLAAALDMQGAFNSATVLLQPGASEHAVKERMDQILEPYGSLGTIGRDEQLSARFLDDEITQVRVQATIVPTVFLAVAVFLLNISLLRLVSTQRMYIAILKAFGYSNAAIGLHYIGFAIVAVFLGTILGIWGGREIGVWLTQLYAQFYRFPVLRFEMPQDVLVVAVIISITAAVIGALSAVRTALRLPPADAMRPESPKTFRPGLFERLPLLPRLSPIGNMIARNIERRPVKAALSVTMIALATAILVLGRFLFDTFDGLMSIQFDKIQRDDVALTFAKPVSHSSMFDLLSLPGVTTVEPYRMVGVDMSAHGHIKRTAIQAMWSDTAMRRIVDAHERIARLPHDGLLLSRRLADALHVQPGDLVDVKLLEEDRRTISLPVSGLVDDLLGVQAYTTFYNLAAILDEQGSLSGAYLAVDRNELAKFNTAVKNTPIIAGVAVKQAAIQSFKDNYGENMNISSTWIVAFAVIIAFGVVYNSARIALSERGNELASLRVLGFTNGEITIVLLGEQVVLTLIALPIGMILGYGMSSILPDAFATDMLRMPFVFSIRNLGLATLTIVSVALATGLLVRRRLTRLDLVAVLKSRE